MRTFYTNMVMVMLMAKKIIFKFIKSIQNLILQRYELPFVPLKNRSALVQGRDQKIPKCVYQTFSINGFGKTHLREISKFRELNPGLEFQFFDRKSADVFM